LVIFDCNGVLVDSEPIISAVIAEALRGAGVSITAEAVTQYFSGRRASDIFAEVEAKTGRRLPLNFSSSVAYATMNRLRASLRATPHAAYALSWLRGPKCAVSASSLERIKLCLDVTDLRRHFGDHLFSVNDLTAQASKADLFLHVAGSVGIAAPDCIVVEDQPEGIAAARAAGMKAIGYTGGSHAGVGLESALMQAGAEAVIHDMRALKGVMVNLRGY
jgi:beta-phosphoglucomutase-like phosphatase (HAD superfamily)